MKHIAGVNTPSQRWARRMGACVAGRRRLGRQSIYNYFCSCWSVSDMRWIAARLKPAYVPESMTSYATLLTEYQRALHHHHSWVRGGSSNVLLCRVALRLIMEAYDVQWPSEIL